MLRSFKRHCALGTLALACGGSTDDNLFGDAVDVQTGGSSAGPKVTPSGGTSTSPMGGSAAVTGGRASGTGGARTAQGGGTEAGSGGASAGLSGMGGSSPEGGSEPGGGTSTGGKTNPSGGARASGGSGNATGGTVSASGGVVSGGSGGASGGNPSGKGGSGGTVSCQQAREAVNAALEAAQACENDKDDQCLGFVDGECCPVPVNDPSSTEAQQYQAALTKMNKVCGVSICPAVLCAEPKGAVCESKSSGSGRCVAKSILPL